MRAGIRQFPFPNLRYGCGMGKCAKCASRIIKGGEQLPAPNWKEKKRLGTKLDEGYRLVCQLWLNHDIELAQDDKPIEPLAAHRREQSLCGPPDRDIRQRGLRNLPCM